MLAREVDLGFTFGIVRVLRLGFGLFTVGILRLRTREFPVSCVAFPRLTCRMTLAMAELPFGLILPSASNVNPVSISMLERQHLDFVRSVVHI